MRFLVAAALLTSCAPAGGRCTATSQCDDLQACLEGVCEDVECRSSTQCPLETFCHPETFTCDLGCADSEDCFVGDRCDVELGTCVERSCQNTQTDCELGERCNTETGRCVLDPDPHCGLCRGDEDCKGLGDCVPLTASGAGICFLGCSPEAFDPCPAGLQCSAFTNDAGEPDGFRCIGQCGGL